VDVRLLGPFEVESDGRDATPERQKQRILLAALALNANRVVATDDLVEILWGSSPPATAQKALHGHVSALRRRLGPDTIETRAPGYVLHVERGSVDAERFERLVQTAREEGDLGRRRELLCGALSLVRGEPLADFRYEQFARDEAARLQALHLAALTERIEADLELGRHHAVVPELEHLVAEHPDDERLRAALMLGLYRAGRQARALQVFADGRRRLVDDLGLEPGPALHELQRRILNHDPALMPTVAPPPASALNLPQGGSPLIGRERDLEEVGRRLLANEARLLTLTGTAGTGKTRLAVEAAAEITEHFPDGVHFVALAPIADPALVLPTIADAVGLDKAAAPDVGELLAHSLAERSLLLVVDNFEHLLDAAPSVSRLVAKTRNLRVLATSRERLHVEGERVYPVPPLELSAAVDLFTERARSLQPSFELTATNSDAVAEICRRLDGLPLAIELAAARITLFPPKLLLDRLDERLKLLTTGGRDRPARHQTLRAAIDWSYELLSESQQALLTRLSVFAGGCTLEAAEAVCADDMDLIDELAALIDKSLVRREGTDAEPRFAMLETIREYARERLAERDEETTRRRHAEFFLAFAEELEPVLSRAGGREAQQRLLTDLDNFRTALAWSIGTENGMLALRLIWALWRFWWDHGLAAESYAWTQRALAAAPDAPPDVRGRAVFAAADVFYARGDWENQRRMYDEAIELLAEGGDEEHLLYALWARAVADSIRGHEVDVAERKARDALARAEAGGYAEVAGRCNILLGYNAQTRGDADTARKHFERAAEKFDELGDLYGRAMALENLAVAALFDRDAHGAARALAESFDSWDFSQNLHNLGHTLVVAAGIAQQHDEAVLATRLLGAVAATFERLGVLLQPNETRVERRTRELAQVALGPAWYQEELRRGAETELADALAVVRQRLRRWSTTPSPSAA
jgi:predicted ATPase/DNA-binding SARP family transcriptional activator